MIIHITLLMLVLFLSGCASGFKEIKLSEDHPAHPEATATSLPLRSQSLAIAEQDRHSDARAAAGAESVNQGDHSAMDHGNSEAEREEKEDEPEGIYACPMHPEVTSNDPEARCPKCGMRLELKE